MERAYTPFAALEGNLFEDPKRSIRCYQQPIGCRDGEIKVWRLTSGAIWLCLLAGCEGSARPSVTTAAQSPALDAANAIRAMLAEGRNPAFGPLAPGEREQLTTLYAPQANAPLWVDASGRPSRDARDALALLGGAADDGLDPVDYSAAPLERLSATLQAVPTPRAPDVAAFDTGLSVSILLYLRHLHAGRVDPREIGFRMAAPADDHDYTALVRAALASHGIIDTAAKLAPPFALYRRLRGTLPRYRSLAADPTLGSLPAPAAPVRPGQPYAGLGALHRLLMALGDLPAETPAPAESSTYDGPLVEGVKRFQIRHGLQADGVLSKDTQAALRVPLSWRVRQIEFALERLRWLPHLGEKRFVAVNIPMFRLWAWDSLPPDGTPSFQTGAIVGRALNTQTPVFVEEMRYIIFRPYWNVPPSILRHEILPALDRDPDYLERHDMEIVSGQGDDARPVPVTAETIAQLRQGKLRVRQRPGPKNALGLVKFVFPNDYNVYLHGTPSPELFKRARRDFSHGCVRVEDPVALAEWALKEQPEWTRERIVAAMNADQPRQVNLTRPIQVLLYYITAAVMPEDGTVHFAEDIYGHDTKLERALRTPPLGGPPKSG